MLECPRVQNLVPKKKEKGFALHFKVDSARLLKGTRSSRQWAEFWWRDILVIPFKTDKRGLLRHSLVT